MPPLKPVFPPGGLRDLGNQESGCRMGPCAIDVLVRCAGSSNPQKPLKKRNSAHNRGATSSFFNGILEGPGLHSNQYPKQDIHVHKHVSHAVFVSTCAAAPSRLAALCRVTFTLTDHA